MGGTGAMTDPAGRFVRFNDAELRALADAFVPAGHAAPRSSCEGLWRELRAEMRKRGWN
jgi:hypothetical protein